MNRPPPASKLYIQRGKRTITAIMNSTCESGPAPQAAYCRETFAEACGLPVLVAALNEEKSLPRTLAALARQIGPVLPIVIDNGSTDRTAEVAEDHGAIVMEQPEKGKLRALQLGLEYVRTNRLGSLVLMTDADTAPVRRWSLAYGAAADTQNPDLPEVYTGLVFYNGARNLKELLINAARPAYANSKNVYRSLKGQPPMTRGLNMAVNLDNQDAAYEAIMNLPNLFPGEDLAIRDRLLALGGTVINLIHLNSAVVSDGDRYASFTTIFKRMRQGAVYQDQNYGDYDLPTQSYLSPFDMPQPRKPLNNTLQSR